MEYSDNFRLKGEKSASDEFAIVKSLRISRTKDVKRIGGGGRYDDSEGEREWIYTLLYLEKALGRKGECAEGDNGSENCCEIEMDIGSYEEGVEEKEQRERERKRATMNILCTNYY